MDTEYPSESDLDRLEHWPFDDTNAALEFAVSLWSYPDAIRRYDGVLYMATGGWSGNESVIDAMMHNIGIRCRWICSTVGGAHEFELEPGYRQRSTRFDLQQALDAIKIRSAVDTLKNIT